ncbi:hypothetical protein [Sulfurimonas sp. HSL3-7]|uniref:hypothetical protein n=1 Tax=Sulfonitrofixus jiaomeiensis TaxID=3131938 RepID=UPI0031F89AF8
MEKLLWLLAGAAISYILQRLHVRNSDKETFAREQLKELYIPLDTIINEEFLMNIENSGNPARQYDYAYTIIELITKKSFYASHDLKLAVHSLRHHFKLENEVAGHYNNLEGDEKKAAVWTFKEEENETNLEQVLDVIHNDLQQLKSLKPLRTQYKE